MTRPEGGEMSTGALTDRRHEAGLGKRFAAGRRRMDVTGAPALTRPSPRESEQAEFFADVYPSLVAALSLMLRDRCEAEDVAQDALVQLVARLDRLAPAVADLRAYAFRTAFNVAPPGAAALRASRGDGCASARIRAPRPSPVRTQRS